MTDWLIWIGLFALASLTFFSTLSLALRFPSRARMAEQFEKTGRGEAFAAFLSVRPQYVLAAAVVRSTATLAILLIGLAMADSRQDVSQSVARITASVASLALVLVFGVAIPTAWARYGGVALIVRVLSLLRIVRVVCYPAIVVLQLFDPFVRRLAGVPAFDAKSYADELEQEILDVVSEGERHGAVDEQEKEMIESVIELTDTLVEEIMTPRTDIIAVAKDANLPAVLDIVRAKGHSRIPVYNKTIDTILGVLYAKDLLLRDQQDTINVTAVMRKVLFIPESKHVRDLLREFQAQKLHIAIVLDEYGGTAGLVTIEDILEELVGEIRDEYDPAAPAELKRIDQATVEVDARMRIDDLNDELNIELPEDGDYETIGGFVFSEMGKIPKVGERCAKDNVSIVVIGAEARRVTRLRLTIASAPIDSPATD